jgi:hypothetical protein
MFRPPLIPLRGLASEHTFIIPLISAWNLTSVNKNQFALKPTRITATLHEEVCTFVIISHWIVVRRRNVSDRFVEKIKTHMLCSITCSRKSCLLSDVEKYCRPVKATDDGTIRRTRFACQITKAKNTDAEYVILIAFPRQKWLHKRA